MNSQIAVRSARQVSFVCAAAVMTALVVAMASPRAGAQEVVMQKISYADLDPQQTGDAAQLYRRLESAARQVCGYSLSATPKERTAARQCYRQALEDAVARVNAPALSALYRERVAQNGG